MAVVVKNKKGEEVTLLNPAEKGRKFAAEIKYGVHITNTGKRKHDKDGKQIELDKTARAYRAGYLDARKDGAKVYKANKAKESVKRAAKKTAKKK